MEVKVQYLGRIVNVPVPMQRQGSHDDTHGRSRGEVTPGFMDRVSSENHEFDTCDRRETDVRMQLRRPEDGPRLSAEHC